MPTSTGKIYLGSNLISGGSSGSSGSSAVAPTPDTWVRNPSWPTLGAANAGMLRGLYAVWPGDGVGYGGNFFSVIVSGAYGIVYGDGQVTNYASGTTAYKEYEYNDPQLANTNAPVTFTASTNIVNRTSHGYSNGMVVNFYNIVTTTGLIEAATYYVINATANTFKVSLTEGGATVVLTNNGTATLLPYKVATVGIIYSAGGASTITSINLHSKHNQADLSSTYSTGWLDIDINASSCTTLRIGAPQVTTDAPVVFHRYLERVKITQIGAITSFNHLFYSCLVLADVSIPSTITTVTDMSYMFYGCTELTSVPSLNTSAVTDMSYMFSGCNSIISVPSFDTSAVTDMRSMFNECYRLFSVPLFDTSAVTNMERMFLACYAITSIPSFDTSAVTDMNYMLFNLGELTSIPSFDTSAVTNMERMFYGCTQITTVPSLNTSLVTNMNNMFFGCISLTSVPLFNTSAVTNMERMFYQCIALTTVPLFNTSACTNMSYMFFNCRRLTSVPLFNTSLVTSMDQMVRECYSLTTFPLLDTSQVQYMNYMFAGCGKLRSIPLLDTSAVTNASSWFSRCYSLTTFPLLDVTALAGQGIAMFDACHSLTSIPALDFSLHTNLAYYFRYCYSLTRIQVTGMKRAVDISHCKLSSAALNEIYTNLGTAYNSSSILTVGTALTGNYGVGGDNPAIATAKGWTVTG